MPDPYEDDRIEAIKQLYPDESVSILVNWRFGIRIWIDQGRYNITGDLESEQWRVFHYLKQWFLDRRGHIIFLKFSSHFYRVILRMSRVESEDLSQEIYI